ncbi:hypothetical protein V6N11_068686 [Hibiscus sabdariffa]|uniref:Uncharacterized protein n=1 Tax=Hibiscus sabdariffa TaxID=183260 RepID=A0ABR2PAF8_9ROSI
MSSWQRAVGKEANNGDGSVSGCGKLRSDSKEDICVDHKGIQSQQERSEERGGVDPDSGSPTMEDEHSIEWEKEAFNDLFIGKDYSAIKGQDIGNIDRHIGESDLLGVNCMDALNKGGCAVVGDEFGVLPLETATLSEDRGCLEALEPNVCCKSPVQAALVSPNFKASEDAHIIGLSRDGS